MTPNDIPNIEFKESFDFYTSLQSPIIKGLQIKVGDCVYIYRNGLASVKIDATKKPYATDEEKFNHLITMIKQSADCAIKNKLSPYRPRECIIIRVQHLAIVKSTKQRMLFGHLYIWPSETYHEPTRKFYTDEVLRSPVCEWAPLEEVRGLCAVLDPSTYVKGRPKGFSPENVYICEMRVDKKAKSFSRIPKISQFSINTKSYAFDMFAEKLKIRRTYSVILLKVFFHMFLLIFSSIATSNPRRLQEDS